MEELLEALWAVLELGMYGVDPLIVIFLLLLLVVCFIVLTLAGVDIS